MSQFIGNNPFYCWRAQDRIGNMYYFQPYTEIQCHMLVSEKLRSSETSATIEIIAISEIKRKIVALNDNYPKIFTDRSISSATIAFISNFICKNSFLTLSWSTCFFDKKLYPACSFLSVSKSNATCP